MSAHTSFLAHERFRWFKRSAWLCLITIVVYSAYAPVGGRNGGTWVGYGLGTTGLLLILWLAWLGVKKRRLRSRASYRPTMRPTNTAGPSTSWTQAE